MDHERIKTDILIIGTGLSGLTAALYAARSGKQILAVGEGHGASSFVHGMNIPLHEKDSAECFAKDTLKSGCGLADEKLVRKLCGESVEINGFLSELGIDPDKELLQPLGASWPRAACSGNFTGVKIMNAIERKLGACDHVTLAKLRVLRLAMENGHVCGALGYDANTGRFLFIEADTVVIACGGFSGIFAFSTNTPDIGGDGIAMAHKVGLTLKHLEFIQYEPCVAIYPDAVRRKGMITTMFYDGAVLRNNKGERFMAQISKDGEKVNKDVLSAEIFNEISRGNGTAHGGVYFDATAVSEETLTGLYSAYVKRYADCGIDIRREPFEVAPAPHTSLGGIEIDCECRTNIKGVFACGEVAGGLHGGNRLGGNAGIETLVFGRQAGISAANHKENQNHSDPQKLLGDIFNVFSGNSGRNVDDIRHDLQAVLTEALNVVRSKDALSKGYARLNELHTELLNPSVGIVYEKLRLENDIITALLVLQAAQNRDLSIGCHRTQ